MSELMSLQLKEGAREEQQVSATAWRGASSGHSQCQEYAGMTTARCPQSNKLAWWGCVPVTADWRVMCIKIEAGAFTNQPAYVVKVTKRQGMYSRDVPFTRRQNKLYGRPTLHWQPTYGRPTLHWQAMYGRPTLYWQPVSMATDKSWRRRLHSSLEMN